MFKFGILIKMKEMQPILKFHTDLILKNMYKLGTVHVTDFANDLDYYQQLRFTKKGPNSLGRMDKHKINFTQKQLHPSMIGMVDLLESSKDVGQSGMISPWANIDTLLSNDVSLTFDCDNIVDFNRILDNLAMSAYVNFEYKIPEWNPISDSESE